MGPAIVWPLEAGRVDGIASFPLCFLESRANGSRCSEVLTYTSPLPPCTTDARERRSPHRPGPPQAQQGPERPCEVHQGRCCRQVQQQRGQRQADVPQAAPAPAAPRCSGPGAPAQRQPRPGSGAHAGRCEPARGAGCGAHPGRGRHRRPLWAQHLLRCEHHRSHPAHGHEHHGGGGDSRGQRHGHRVGQRGTCGHKLPRDR
mmetsp:Transcript_69476/g.219893  ORF Transcript_69476/g.219893 Transcript_69476/m.219893 type:complete len:202 (+) Transcript_69476:1943-2548(+)